MWRDPSQRQPAAHYQSRRLTSLFWLCNVPAVIGNWVPLPDICSYLSTHTHARCVCVRALLTLGFNIEHISVRSDQSFHLFIMLAAVRPPAEIDPNRVIHGGLKSSVIPSHALYWLLWVIQVERSYFRDTGDQVKAIKAAHTYTLYMGMSTWFATCVLIYDDGWFCSILIKINTLYYKMTWID